MLHEKLKGLPSCHVVNLEESVDRKFYIENAFKQLGITNYKIHQYKRIHETDLKITGDEEVINTITTGPSSSHLLTIKWWYENTDEEVAMFLEDDVDFSTMEHWNFVFEDYIKKFGKLWEVLQLSVVHEGWPVMYPRHRTGWDHGLQCYMLKRHYAKRLIDYYFVDDKTLYFPKMVYHRQPKWNVQPQKRLAPTTENVIYSLGCTYVHPLVNHKLDFINHSTIQQGLVMNVDYAKNCQQYVKQWWERKASGGTLDQLFDYDWCCPKESGQSFGHVFRIDN